MISDRMLVREMMEASLLSDAAKLKSLIVNYSQEHAISIRNVLTSCRDGNRRNVLHFACQSTENSDDAVVDSNHSSDDAVDIVEFILQLLVQPTVSTPTPTTTSQSDDNIGATTATTNPDPFLMKLIRAKDKNASNFSFFVATIVATVCIL